MLVEDRQGVGIPLDLELAAQALDRSASGITIKWAPNPDDRSTAPVHIWGEDADPQTSDEISDMDAAFGLPPGTLGLCSPTGYV